MKDPLRSPSKHLRDWTTGHLRRAFSPGALHPITLLLILAAILDLLGGLVGVVSQLVQAAHQQLTNGVGTFPIPDLAAEALYRLAGSLSFLGTAATVEYLFRIWTELRMRRLEPRDAVINPPRPTDQ